jgi:hypothetical protein
LAKARFWERCASPHASTTSGPGLTLHADLPGMEGTYGVGPITGTASKITGLSSPAEGQSGSRVVEVTWTLRALP